MSSFKPEMNPFKSETIDEKLLEATVDRYKADIRRIVNIKNEDLVCTGIVLQAFVDNRKVAVKGLKAGEIPDNFLQVCRNFNGKYNWCRPWWIAVVRKGIRSLWVVNGELSLFSLINLSSLTPEVVGKRIGELIKSGVVKKDDVDGIPGIDLSVVSSEIKQILPGGELFRNFIVLLSELHKRSGYSIALPSVSDFVNLGRRFIALVAEKSELEEKCSLTAEKAKKIEDEKISLENELQQIKERLSSAWKYATDGVYSSDDDVKVVKTVEPANLNGIASGIAMEKVGVYNNEEFGLVTKKNADKAKLLDATTYDVYDTKTQDAVEKGLTYALVNTIQYMQELQRQIQDAPLVIDCKSGVTQCKNQSKSRQLAIRELDDIFPHVSAIASLFRNINYEPLNSYELVLLKVARQNFVSGIWDGIDIPEDRSGEKGVTKLKDQLERAKVAAGDAVRKQVGHMLACNVGNANNANKLRRQLLLAAIAGYSAEDIKKTIK